MKCLECLEELTLEERVRGAIYSQAINVAVWAENAERIFRFKYEPEVNGLVSPQIWLTIGESDSEKNSY